MRGVPGDPPCALRSEEQRSECLKMSLKSPGAATASWVGAGGMPGEQDGPGGGRTAGSDCPSVRANAFRHWEAVSKTRKSP